MKKFLLYILILVALIGTLSLPIKVRAEDPNGTCTLKATLDGTIAKFSATEKHCHDLAADPAQKSIFVSWVPDSPATTTTTNTTVNYHLLAPLPGLTDFNTANDANGKNTALGSYLNLMIKLFIGICAVLAVVMIVMGGLEYMTNELISSKEHGKERITGAIFGLILALGAYTLLYTINPDILNTDLQSLKSVTVEVKLEPETGVQGGGPEGKTIVVSGMTLTACDESQITTTTLFGHSVQVNKAIVNNLKRIDAKWNAMPATTRYKINTIGGYDCRPVTNKPGFWSAHAYGLALDINEATNPFDEDKTDMPNSFSSLFTSEGWGWGNNWNNLNDAMHFSKIPPAEGGNGNLN